MAVELRQHLADQGRTASRGVEHQGAGCQPGAASAPFIQGRQGCFATQRLIERQAQGLIHRIAKERLMQRSVAEPAPVHPPARGRTPDTDWQPALQVQ